MIDVVDVVFVAAEEFEGEGSVDVENEEEDWVICEDTCEAAVVSLLMSMDVRVACLPVLVSVHRSVRLMFSKFVHLLPGVLEVNLELRCACSRIY